MFSPEIYGFAYLTVVTILSLFMFKDYSAYTYGRIKYANTYRSSPLSLLLTVGCILFIGFRPMSYLFVDMGNYYQMYYRMRGMHFLFTSETSNFLFDNIFAYFAAFDIGLTMFYLFIAAIYFICIYISVRRIFPNDTLYALLVYLAAFSTFSFATNGIKAGAAASIFLLVFAFFSNKTLAIAFAVISLGFHHSMIFPIVAICVAYFFRNTKWYFYFWGICFIIAGLHITYFQHLFAGFSEGANSYLSHDAGAMGIKAGFRIDFIIYGSLPILVGYWAVYKHHVTDKLYILLLNTYIATNAIWMLTMYAPFNNRIAYLSWFILPIVSIYPFLKIKIVPQQYKYLNYVAMIYLSFKLFAYNILGYQ